MLRLLIVDDGIAAVADLTAADRTGDGELDILGQQMIIPAAFLAEHISRNQKTGAGNRTVDAQTGSRAVQEARLTQEPQCIACGDPVRAEVLRITVAGQCGILAGIVHLVHLTDELRIYDVVRIEYEKRVVRILTLLLKNMLEQIIQRVALADLHLIKSLVHDRTGTARYLSGIVRAVICNNNDIKQL